MKGFRLLSLLAVLTLSQQAIAFNLPIQQITFDNNTELHLGATIAGLPGKDIPPNTPNYSVPFGIVFAACIYSASPNNCPVNFKNKANNEEVASVYIDVMTGHITNAPTLHGSYAATFSVSGWETKPINKIIINRK